MTMVPPSWMTATPRSSREQTTSAVSGSGRSMRLMMVCSGSMGRGRAASRSANRAGRPAEDPVAPKEARHVVEGGLDGHG
jgi:hypothetical protein